LLRQKARQASAIGASGFHAEVSLEGLLLLQPIQELPEPLRIIRKDLAAIFTIGFQQGNIEFGFRYVNTNTGNWIHHKPP